MADDTSEDGLVDEAEVAAAPTGITPATVTTRARAPIDKVNTMLQAVLPVLNDIAADTGDRLTALRTLELQGTPVAQHDMLVQKARGILRLVTEAQDTLHKISQGMAAEKVMIDRRSALTEVVASP
jgi:hypothetical protein